MNRRYRSSTGTDAGVGCIVILLIILLNLALLAAGVWVVASVIKAVFGL